MRAVGMEMSVDNSDDMVTAAANTVPHSLTGCAISEPVGAVPALARRFHVAVCEALAENLVEVRAFSALALSVPLRDWAVDTNRHDVFLPI